MACGKMEAEADIHDAAVKTMRRAQWFLMSLPMLCGSFLLSESVAQMGPDPVRLPC